MRKAALAAADVLAEDRRRLVALTKGIELVVVESVEELGALAAEAAVDLTGAVDLLVILPLCAAQLAKALLAHGDAVAAEAVLDDVDDKRLECPGVVRAAEAVVEGVLAQDPRADGVLAVLAHVGDHVGDAHDAALEGHRAQVADCALPRLPAGGDQAVEGAELRQPARLEDLLLELAVVREAAVQGLQAHVAAAEHVDHAHGLDVVEEPPAGAGVEGVVQEALASVAEGRVPEVVAERDGLDEVEVQAQGAPDVASDARHELHMQPAAREVVVGPEAEDLGLSGHSVVGGKVNYLLGIADEGRTDRGVAVALGGAAADGRGVPAGEGRKLPGLDALGDGGGRRGRQLTGHARGEFIQSLLHLGVHLPSGPRARATRGR